MGAGTDKNSARKGSGSNVMATGDKGDDWFKTTLYTRVLVNLIKWMEKPPIYGARSSTNI